MYLKALAIALSLVVFPFEELEELVRTGDASYLESNFFLLLAKEVFMGFLLVFVVGTPFWIAGVAGTIIDAQRGGGFSETVSPISGDDTTVVGILFWLFMVTAYFMSGGLLTTLTLVYESFTLWPVLSLSPQIDFDRWHLVIGLLDVIVVNAFIIVLPFVTLMLLTDLALFYMSTFIPQLNVFAVSMPIKSGIAALVMVVYVTSIPELIAQKVDLPALLRSYFET